MDKEPLTKGYVFVAHPHIGHSQTGQSLGTIPPSSPPVEREYRPTASKRDDQQLAMRSESRTAVVKLREKLFLKRLNLKELRNELRQERELEIGYHAQLDALLRTSWAKGDLPPRPEFETLYERSRNCKDKLGELQYQYDELEADYDALEEDFEELEKSLFIVEEDNNSIEGHHINLMQETSEAVCRTSASSADTGYLLRDDDILRRYQSRLGDGNILWERQQDQLHALYKRLEVSRIQRPGIIDVDEPLRQSIEDLEAACREGEAALEDIKINIKDLAAQATKAGFTVMLPFWITTGEIAAQTVENVATQQEQQSESYPESWVRDAPQFHYNLSTIRATVNVWILQQLQESCVQRAQHKAILQALYDYTDNKTWARLLWDSWWESDEFGEFQTFSNDFIEEQEEEMSENSVKIQLSSKVSVQRDSLAWPEVDIARKAISDFLHKFPLSEVLTNQGLTNQASPVLDIIDDGFGLSLHGKTSESPLSYSGGLTNQGLSKQRFYRSKSNEAECFKQDVLSFYASRSI